jgi:hypothetical protein
MSDMGSRSVIRRLWIGAAIVLVAAAWLVAVNSAPGAAVPPAPGQVAMTSPPPPSGGPSTPNTSPFPPTPPTNLHATSVTSNSVTLEWTASSRGCCAIAGYSITYRDVFNDIFWSMSVGNVTSVTVTENIRPTTQYSFRVSAFDSLGHTSGTSNEAQVMTPLYNGSDTVPPSAPTNLQAAPPGADTVALSWAPSTDNQTVVGYYVYRFDGVFVSTRLAFTSGTSYTARLAQYPSHFYVRAVDSSGNASFASNRVFVNATTSPSASSSPSTPQLSCRVGFVVASQWSAGYVATITITNTGATPIVDWELTYRFPGDQRITNAWNAIYVQAGPAVTMTHSGWNRTILPGGSVQVGYLASGAPQIPTEFFINGVRCST